MIAFAQWCQGFRLSFEDPPMTLSDIRLLQSVYAAYLYTSLSGPSQDKLVALQGISQLCRLTVTCVTEESLLYVPSNA